MTVRSEHFIQAVRGPSGLPRLASKLQQMSTPGGIFEKLEIEISIEALGSDVHGYGPDELPDVLADATAKGQQMGRWYDSTLRSAELWWCSEDMTDMICDVAMSMPDDVTLGPELPLSMCGLVVFDRPIIGSSVDSDTTAVHVHGVIWGPTNLPATSRTPDGTPCISMMSLVRVADGYKYPDGEIADMPFGQELWAPLGRSDWPIGFQLDEAPNTLDPRSSVQWTIPRLTSMKEDRAIMAALWTVARTHTVAHVVESRPDRPERRRLERQGAAHADSLVNVVHLRREVARTHQEGAEHVETGRHLTHRHLVRAHLRNQACGPNRSERRLVLIPPHIKGPEGAPMLKSKRVWSLDR